MAKTRSVILGIVFVCSSAGATAPAWAQAERSFEGEIADSQCATNVHSLSRSHKEMIAMSSAGKTPTDCAHYCVHQRGGKYVLQIKNEVYHLDRQDLAEKSAGTKVRVSGTLDTKTNIIQVRSIDPIILK
jgi:hypothetical protein